MTAPGTSLAQELPQIRGKSGARAGLWVAATVAGNALEFFDFLTYTFFSVYIGRAFFPTANPWTSLLLSLATFGVGFFTRPLGGILIGAYADRAGRRPALMLTIGLMSVGTLALAFTPSYSSIGIAAPLILVAARLVQGLALGGEVGPSTAVLLENASHGRIGAFVSWQISSQGIAIFAAGITAVVLSNFLDAGELAAWGWRVPFALGLLIVPVGLYLRRNLPESLLATESNAHSTPRVLLQLLRVYRRQIVLAVLVIMSITITTYVNNFMSTYALTTLAMPASAAMWGSLANGTFNILGGLAGGWLCDRYGSRVVMIAPRVALMLFIYPAFLLLASERTPWMLCLVTGANSILSSLSAAAAMVAIVQVFPNAVRGSGTSISYAASVSLFGGTTQFVIAWLIGVTGSPYAPALYVIATGFATLWAMWKLPSGETARETAREAAARQSV
jgi:MFS family permease